MNILNSLRNIDHQTFIYLNSWAGHNHYLDKLFIFFGEYLVYIIPIFLLVLWFWSKDTKKIAMQITTAGLFAWFVLSYFVGALHYRVRPYNSIIGTHELIFHRPDRSFPSDHAAFLFAIAFSLWFFGYKKLSVAMFILAILNSAGRIVIGVHYPSDVIAGVLIGLISAALVWWLRKPLDFIYDPIIKAAKKVKLA